MTIPPGHVVALHEYQAQGDLELSLKPGDIIECVGPCRTGRAAGMAAWRPLLFFPRLIQPSSFLGALSICRRLVNKEDETWWCGRLNGVKGMFPANFVRGPGN